MKLTIFTPTYNRSNLIKRLYESICPSKEKDFEWIIVDDGSTDDTSSVVSKFQEAQFINIVYIKKQNGGKPSAYNVGIENARGDLFFCVDDDDYLFENAIEEIFSLYNNIMSDDSICGFAGRSVAHTDNKDISGTILNNIKLNTIESKDKHSIHDVPEVYKTNLLKKYRFPIISGEKFITEAVVFDMMTSKTPLLYTTKKLMVKEYINGGLTDNSLKIRVNNPKGAILYYEQRVKLTKSVKHKAKAIINFMRFSLHNNSNCFLKGHKLMCYCTYFVAKRMYVKDIKKLDRKI